ncbi:MAG: DsbA family protein [Chloroflexi bacterium]|nr:DsbA family protein [Chloroflexota bacterium]
MPPQGLPREMLFRGDYYRRAEENLRRLASEVGLAMISPTVIAKTHLALEAAEFAREHGGFAALHRRIFEAYFQDGKNIGDVEVLVGLAGEAGLDEGELRQALAERRYRVQLEQVTHEAAGLGISGTPTFVIGNRLVVGAQPYDVLRQRLVGAGAKPRQL